MGRRKTQDRMWWIEQEPNNVARVTRKRWEYVQLKPGRHVHGQEDCFGDISRRQRLMYLARGPVSQHATLCPGVPLLVARAHGHDRVREDSAGGSGREGRGRTKRGANKF